MAFSCVCGKHLKNQLAASFFWGLIGFELGYQSGVGSSGSSFLRTPQRLLGGVFRSRTFSLVLCLGAFACLSGDGHMFVVL